MEVNLSAYSGPLDLLLKLISKNEIDIHDIPISQLTAQYLDEIAELGDMEHLSEFLVMAATLLEIKSRMLLPRPKTESEEEPEDPREALVQQLLAYSQAQSIAQELLDLTPVGEKFTNLGDMILIAALRKESTPPPNLDTITLSRLAKVFADVIARKEERIDVIRAGYGEMPREKFSVTEKVAHIKNYLKNAGRLNLFALFYDCRSKNEMVVTFLALLEMVRRGMILAAQESAFADVEVIPCRG